MSKKISSLIKKAISKLVGFGVKKAANHFLNEEIPGLGRVVYLNINTDTKEIEIHLLLGGESKEISVMISGYKVIHADGEKYIAFKSIKSRKPWVNALIGKFVPADKRLPVDNRLAWLADRLI